MRKIVLGLILILAALTISISIFWGFARWTNPTFASRNLGRLQSGRYFGPSAGMWGRRMMGGYWQSDNYFQGRAVELGLRISIDEANQRADQFLTAFGSGLKIAEIMEFSNNFYVVVVEEGTGKAAFELLIDPETGSVYPEPGPNMMWNQKYGHMAYARGGLGENQILVENARQLAQEYLDAVLPSAQVEADGLSFYGYYTFDYTVGGKIAGMLSVHAFGGQVWLHTWHGEFIQEMEME